MLLSFLLQMKHYKQSDGPYNDKWLLCCLKTFATPGSKLCKFKYKITVRYRKPRTMGPWDTSALSDIFQHGLIEVSGDREASMYFGQRIRVAIQRGNAAKFLETSPTGSDVALIIVYDGFNTNCFVLISARVNIVFRLTIYHTPNWSLMSIDDTVRN